MASAQALQVAGVQPPAKHPGRERAAHALEHTKTEVRSLVIAATNSCKYAIDETPLVSQTKAMQMILIVDAQNDTSTD